MNNDLLFIGKTRKHDCFDSIIGDSKKTAITYKPNDDFAPNAGQTNDLVRSVKNYFNGKSKTYNQCLSQIVKGIGLNPSNELARKSVERAITSIPELIPTKSKYGNTDYVYSWNAERAKLNKCPDNLVYIVYEELNHLLYSDNWKAKPSKRQVCKRVRARLLTMDDKRVYRVLDALVQYGYITPGTKGYTIANPNFNEALIVKIAKELK